MESINDAIVFNLKASRGLIDGLTADLTGSDWTHRPAPGANCAAWLVGHLVIVERNILRNLNVPDVPALPEGFEATFSRENNAPHAESFGDPTILVPLFDKLRERVIQAVTKLPANHFEQPLPKPSPRFTTFGEYLTFMGIHVAMHAGQISTIRRSLGRPALF
jgi:uncharacterized damage-inducible protein DinB